MLSQCPHCRAIFNVSEPDIQAHHGLVRCGHCKAIFHAVINEVEDAQALPGETAGTNTLEIPLGDTASPAQTTDPEPEGFPGPTPYLEPLPEPTPQRGATIPPSPDLDEEPEPGGSRDDGPSNDDWNPKETGDPEELTGGDEEMDWMDPVLSGPRTEEDAETATPELPGDIVEEITIEAPPTLVDDFEAELRAAERTATQSVGDAGVPETDGTAGEDSEPVHDRADAPKRRAPPAASQASPTPLKSPYRAQDVRMVELPQPQPFKTASLSLLSVFLVLLLVWQVKTFYLDEIAQVPFLRPYLDTVCRPLGCVLPPRRDFARIELAGTSISINPEVPGALAITASLLNNASFPQPYPPLRVTLTDREGKVVGRRTYLPDAYRPDPGSILLPIGEVREVTINLAQPDRDVVGYEVELVAPVSAGGA